MNGEQAGERSTSMPVSVHISAPASSANLGAGFDALAVAIDIPFEVTTAAEPPEGFLPAEQRHPARVAFERSGGEGQLWWRSPIPPGRGLGFSGAACVAGAAAAGLDRDDAFAVAAEIEGHADNAAASAYGGFCVTDGTSVVSLAMPEWARLAIWSPDSPTSTSVSRTRLPDSVPLGDATANIAHASLLVAATAAGRWGLWAEAVRDRLHQDVRLAGRPDSAEVFDRFVELDPLAVWLSGSGPSIAALFDATAAEAAFGIVPDRGLDDVVPGGRLRVVPVATGGVRTVDPAE